MNVEQRASRLVEDLKSSLPEGATWVQHRVVDGPWPKLVVEIELDCWTGGPGVARGLLDAVAAAGAFADFNIASTVDEDIPHGTLIDLEVAL